MKNKKKMLLPCILFLCIVTFISFQRQKSQLEQLLLQTGYELDLDIEGSAIRENDRFRENEREYQRMLEEENNPNQKTESQAEVNPDNQLSLYARSALLLDADNNRVLYEENGYAKVAMASTTKIMTCIVALEHADLEDVVTVSKYASTMPDVQLNIIEGQKFKLGDLLYSLMLESHNDVAVAVAEHVGGSVEGFAGLMNEKAKELGCLDTNFVTPNGLDAQDHYTTARDLAVIASYAIKNDKFIKITNQDTWSFQDQKTGKTYHVSNKNRFLYMMEGAIGVKTGFTNMAGYCFVGAIDKNEKKLISVVLGSGWPPHKTYKWTDTKNLMDFGLKRYHYKQIFEPIDLKQVPVDQGTQRYVELILQGDLGLLLRDDETVSIRYDIPEVLKAPVKAKEQVGCAKYYIDDQLYETLPVYAGESIDKMNLPYCIRFIWRRFLSLDET